MIDKVCIKGLRERANQQPMCPQPSTSPAYVSRLPTVS